MCDVRASSFRTLSFERVNAAFDFTDGLDGCRGALAADPVLVPPVQDPEQDRVVHRSNRQGWIGEQVQRRQIHSTRVRCSCHDMIMVIIIIFSSAPSEK